MSDKFLPFAERCRLFHPVGPTDGPECLRDEIALRFAVAIVTRRESVSEFDDERVAMKAYCMATAFLAERDRQRGKK